jgi:hypothetical protein
MTAQMGDELFIGSRKHDLEGQPTLQEFPGQIHCHPETHTHSHVGHRPNDFGRAMLARHGERVHKIALRHGRCLEM